jgi:erythromycin esterase-like protein
MKTVLKLSFILLAGALLLPVSPTQANVQPAQEFRATPAATASATFQTAQAKKTACPEGTRWSEGAKLCVKKR